MNLGKYDIIIRAIVGLICFVYGMNIALESLNILGLPLAGGGIILMVTALVRWCPIYAFLGLSSCHLKT